MHASLRAPAWLPSAPFEASACTQELESIVSVNWLSKSEGKASLMDLACYINHSCGIVNTLLERNV